MADHEHTRQRFEDHCWQHYMAERQRRDMPGDVPDAFPTREQLFHRLTDGRYGVLMFNAAWLAWCWAMGEKGAEPSAVGALKDERDLFEAIFPIPPGCIRCGDGYAATSYSAWKAHDHVERWKGWIGRAALSAPQPVAPVAWTWEQKASSGGWDRKILFCAPSDDPFVEKRNVTPLYALLGAKP